MKGSLGENTFTGDPERYIKQGSEMGVCFHRGPVLGEHGGALLSYETFEGYTNDLQTGFSLHRGPVEEPGGDSFAGDFLGKR